MKKKGILIIFIGIILLAGITFFYITNKPIPKSSFEIVPSLFKIVLDKGETISEDLEIKNFGKKNNFSLKIGNLNGIVYLEKNNLIIEKGNSGKVKVNISGLNSVYGAHMGHISVSNGLTEKIIPFVASIQTHTQFFAINLDAAPENKHLIKKDNLITDIKFFNLYDDNSHTINVNYKILNINGEKILSESEQITIGSKSSLTKKFSLPQDIALGDYVFVVSLDYLNTITTSSYLFSVVSKKPFSFFNINLLAWIVIIFTGITFLLILYLIYERVTLFSQLKKQQHEQVTFFSKKISKEKKRRLAKAKTQKQKKKIIAELQDAKTKILTALKKQQRHQKHELKKLQKKKDIEAKKRKLCQWRKESYPKAVRSAQISSDLKNKLVVLGHAYKEGFIKKDSYKKGVSKIKSADKKQKTKIYK